MEPRSTSPRRRHSSATLPSTVSRQSRRPSTAFLPGTTTCWEDSIRRGWADPARPAEIIEVGLATYRVDTGAVTASFQAFVHHPNLCHPTPINRDELRALARLPANPRRHRALDDALDLTHFLALLFAAG